MPMTATVMTVGSGARSSRPRVAMALWSVVGQPRLRELQEPGRAALPGVLAGHGGYQSPESLTRRPSLRVKVRWCSAWISARSWVAIIRVTPTE